MSERPNPEQPIRLDPRIGRFIEKLNIAQQVASVRYGTTIDGLRAAGEPSGDFSRIIEVITEADRIIGPEDQYVRDYNFWQELRDQGHHNQSFPQWRSERRQEFRAEYERLSREIEARNQQDTRQ